MRGWTPLMVMVVIVIPVGAYALAGTPRWIIRVQNFLDRWLNFTLVLFSFVAHLVLVLFAGVRRRQAIGWRRFFVWGANEWRRWAPTYTLGKLSLGSTSQEPHLVILTLWAAFLLLHYGGPDNFTAYSLEDDMLSWREIIEMVLQLVGPIYILIKNILPVRDGDTMLFVSSVLCFMGIHKYVERAFALKQANLDAMRSSSMKKEKPTRQISCLQSLRRLCRQADNEQILLAAHDMLNITKGAFIDHIIYKHEGNEQEILPKSWDENEILYNVVDMELSLMYDILYTKASMVHTWSGYLLHFGSMFTTATVFGMFFFTSKEGQHRADIKLTYIMLGGSVLLDIRWFLRAVASTWTYSFLNDRPHCWLHHAVLCSGKWRLIRHLIVPLDPSRFFYKDKEPASYRKWPGIIGQYNMFDECTRTPTTCMLRRKFTSLLKKVLQDKWMEYRYHCSMGFHMSSCMSSDVRKHLFESIWEFLKSAYPPPVDDKKAEESNKSYSQPPTAPHAPAKERMRRELEEALNISPAFQESILVWQIATDVFLLCSHQYASSSKQVRAIKVLSNYMVFLLAVRPSMLPGHKLRSLCEGVHQALNEILRNLECSGTLTEIERKEKLAKILMEMEKQTPSSHAPKKPSNWRPGETAHCSRPKNASVLYDKNIILSDGTSFAQVLLSRVISSHNCPPGASNVDINSNRYKRLTEMIPELEDDNRAWFPTSDMLDYIFRAWVRLLMYASVRCSRDSHAKQLGCGGELTTMVWILNEHACLFRIHSDNGKFDKSRFPY